MRKIANHLCQIHSHPELAYQEKHAHDAISTLLESLGVEVTRHAYGLATSLEAVTINGCGPGYRSVNFNAEYDALPDIGHACGHNLIAVASITAFLAATHAIRELGIEGRLQLLGTPAEEDGGGKIQLLDAGAYKDIDISLMMYVEMLFFLMMTHLMHYSPFLVTHLLSLISENSAIM